jgi:hypothetical protein
LAENSAPPPTYRPSGNDRCTPTLGVRTQALTRAFRTAAHPSGLRVIPTQAPRSCRVSPASKLLGGPGSHLRPPSLQSCFVAQPSNPDSFVVNRRKPRRLGAASTPIPLMTWPPRRPGSVLVLWSKPTKPRVQTLVVSRYPVPAPPRNCRLAFLATMRPALDHV